MNNNQSLSSIFNIQNIENHNIKVCKNKLSQTELVVNYIQEGLNKGEGVVIIAKPELRKLVTAALKDLNIDFESAKILGQLKFFDAEFLLSTIHIDGEIDKIAFYESIEPPLIEMKNKFKHVHAMSEMVDILWSDGFQQSAHQLEELWGEIAKKENIFVLVTYLLDSFDTKCYDEFIVRLCKGNAALIPDEIYQTLKLSLIDGIEDVFSQTWNEAIKLLQQGKLA